MAEPEQPGVPPNMRKMDPYTSEQKVGPKEKIEKKKEKKKIYKHGKINYDSINQPNDADSVGPSKNAVSRKEIEQE